MAVKLGRKPLDSAIEWKRGESSSGTSKDFPDLMGIPAIC
jgi:hypothetical protein